MYFFFNNSYFYLSVKLLAQISKCKWTYIQTWVENTNKTKYEEQNSIVFSLLMLILCRGIIYGQGMLVLGND